MNLNLKISKKNQNKRSRIRNSVGFDLQNLAIPRKLNFSGHFHLNTLLFLGG